MQRLSQDRRLERSLTDWQRRLFHNSFTRGGRVHYAKAWSIKLQHAGQRVTWSLKGPTRLAAAREARQRFREWVAQRKTPKTASSVPEEAPRAQWVRRPAAASNTRVGEFALRVPTEEGPCYFPLQTTDPRAAQARGRSLHRLWTRDPERFFHDCPREVTVAFEWSANPLLWTYATLHTQPADPKGTPLVPALEPRIGAVRVALVEPDSGLRIALRSSLNQNPRLSCSPAFSNATDALQGLVGAPIDVVLANHTLDGLSGAGLLTRLQALCPNLTGVTYAPYHTSDELFAATPGGAIGYLLKRTPPSQVLDPLFSGNARPANPPQIAGRAMQWFYNSLGATPETGPAGELARLTTREMEILSLLSKGFLDKEIAASLRISVWTVHGHAKKIYEKLGVHSRTEAAVRYLQK